MNQPKKPHSSPEGEEDRLKGHRTGSPRILFVCFGNICRSPMAVGIARRLLGENTPAESAGIAAAGGPATEEAALVMKAAYKVDISGHRARSLDGLDLERFDYVIAMDFFVYNDIKKRNMVSDEKLFGWDIEDPLGLGYAAFKRAAGKIESRLAQFLNNQGFGA
jgi:protein-tyrosine-phosphatase